MKNNNDVIIYEGAGGIELKVRVGHDTVWLNRAQIAHLFGRDVKTIGKHINNALKEELDGFSVVAKFATTAKDNKTYMVEHYNLDAILSVGYRVKSSEGILFRQWATNVLRNHLTEGYTINSARLAELNKVIEIVSRASDPTLIGVTNVLKRYASGLEILDAYDHNTLSKPQGKKSKVHLDYPTAREFIDSMIFGEMSQLFGKERDQSFKGSLEAIYQTYDGKELYPSLEEKAANLLYLVVKNHSFVDGNKRIAAALFLYFLELNAALESKQGEPAIDNNSLAAITLMIALSKSEEKEVMCLLVMNMLTNKNN